MTEKERQERIAAIEARRKARGMNDPLNRLTAHIDAAVAKGETVFVNREDPEAALKRDYADLGVSCGYLGGIHCGPVSDDRSFYVFTTLATKPNASACDISVHIFDVPRAHKGIWKDRVEFDTPAVRAKLDAIRERFQRGELFDLRTK